MKTLRKLLRRWLDHFAEPATNGFVYYACAWTVIIVMMAALIDAWQAT